MSEKPRRAHVLDLKISADTLDDLIAGLKMFATDLRLGQVSTRGVSGSPSVGWMYDYSVDESWTHDRYFEAIEETIANDD
jgi:hypothetical protein